MVRTRFAPSPTGYLHIGGVRTALFNWLHARRHGGAFILRIDDTDEQRNLDSALAPILAGFRWLGLDWDEGPEVGGPHEPYFQSGRLQRYQEAAAELVRRGLAYHDYATSEEIQAEREAAQDAKQRFVYSRRFMAETEVDRRRLAAAGRSAVVRLKMPRQGVCAFADHVRGKVQVEWAGEQDHVIQRADGTCLYHLASVVDDHDMEITHVIRAEEHLSNTPRQIFIAQGLGYAPPEYAHLPYVAEPGSKNKLSKRKLERYLKNPDFARLNQRGHEIAAAAGMAASAETFNPVIVNFYEKIGYLPEALINYLLLLGWSLDDHTEFLSREAMIASFSLERVNRAPASFDPRKLAAFQGHYMQAVPLQQKVEMVLPFLRAAGLAGEGEAVPNRLEAVLQAAGNRIEMAGDILQQRTFFVDDAAVAYDEEAVDKRLRRPPEAAGLLAAFRQRLAGSVPFTPVALEAELTGFVQAEALKISQIIHALRVAVTGSAVGIGLFETLAILGRESCLARIDAALARI